MPTNPKYSIVIPVFNSSSSLIELAEQLLLFFNNTPFQIIFIDDGSTNQDTWKTIEILSNTYSYIKGVRFRKNFGKPSALLCGFKEAEGEYIITMDDDLQHEPAQLSKLIEKEKHDVVIGLLTNKKHSVIKRILSRIKNRVEVWAYHKPKEITVSPFKLIKREIIDDILKIKSNKPFIASLLFAVTHDVVNVSIMHRERKYDSSGFTFKKMGLTFSNLLFNNSSILLKLIAFLGIFLSTICLTGTVYLLIEKVITGNHLNQLTIFMLATSIVSGVLLFAIGIIGEYLIRIINGVEKRPAYFISTKTEN